MTDYSTDDFLGYGTILAMGDGEDPEIFTRIAKVQDIDGPNEDVESIKTTAHDSPDYAHEYKPGLFEGNEVSFPIKINLNNSSHDATTGLYKCKNDRRIANWKLITPIPAPVGFWGFPFKGFIKSLKLKEPVENIITGDVTIKITGKVNIADIDVSQIC